ncbi:PIG-L deacetylase family protein [Streptomyces scabiei]|uniref:PIG-L deacetylase family protein n=1 Tax=Streptomyces scabiei TaxID=1930 RepID=UPI0038F767D0
MDAGHELVHRLAGRVTRGYERVRGECCHSFSQALTAPARSLFAERDPLRDPPQLVDCVEQLSPFLGVQRAASGRSNTRLGQSARPAATPGRSQPSQLRLSARSYVTDVLVFAPHPDDETLGCGGSIAHHTAVGRSVHIVFLTSGEQGVPSTAPERAGLLREREAETAVGKLGVASDHIHFLRLPDGGLSPADQSQFLSVLGILRQARPEVVYLPHEADASHDHQQAHLLVWRALEKGASRSYPDAGPRHWAPTVLGYEVWSAIGVPTFYQSLQPAETEAKLSALACYSTQVKGEGEADYASEGGLALARFRGAMTSGGHREAFAVLRLGALPWPPPRGHHPA